MLIIKSLHIIFFVSWVSGLLYLPRLYVYHCLSYDKISYDRFLLMEKNLLLYIIFPGCFGTLFSGTLMLYLYFWEFYKYSLWLYFKFLCIGLLIIFNIFCIYFFIKFKNNEYCYSVFFYKIFNEIPFVLLIFIVFLVIIKPFT